MFSEMTIFALNYFHTYIEITFKTFVIEKVVLYFEFHIFYFDFI